MHIERGIFMIHSFDVGIAEMYGVHTAVIFQNLLFWIKKNEANEVHFHDGYYWTYNSKKALNKLFPYMTERQIEYAIQKLVDDDCLIVGNYNQSKYDRTLWYAITEKGFMMAHECENGLKPLKSSSSQNCEMESTKLLNASHKIVESNPQNCEIESTILQDRFHKIVEPIPDSKPDSKHTDNKPDEKLQIIEKDVSTEKDTSAGSSIYTAQSDADTSLMSNTAAPQAVETQEKFGFVEDEPSSTEKKRTRKKRTKSKNDLMTEINVKKQPDELPFIGIPLNDGSEFQIYEALVEEWERLYPAVDVRQELRNMRGWSMSNPQKRKTVVGVGRFVANWLQRRQDKGGSRNSYENSRTDYRTGNKEKVYPGAGAESVFPDWFFE